MLLSTGISDWDSMLVLLTSKQRLAAVVQRMQWRRLFGGKCSLCASAKARNINAPAGWDFRTKNNHEVYIGAVVVREGEK
jgi:hypothetical protein